jgi:hypothetical protein
LVFDLHRSLARCLRLVGRGRPKCALAVVAVSAALAACDEGIEEVPWRVRFEQAAAGALADRIAVSIEERGCGFGGGVLYSAVVARGEPQAPMPRALRPGIYGFRGEAFAPGCGTVATGCTHVSFPLRPFASIALSLDGMVPAGCDTVRPHEDAGVGGSDGAVRTR